MIISNIRSVHTPIAESRGEEEEDEEKEDKAVDKSIALDTSLYYSTCKIKDHTIYLYVERQRFKSVQCGKWDGFFNSECQENRDRKGSRKGCQCQST